MRIDKTYWILKITILALLILPFYSCRLQSRPPANALIKNDSLQEMLDRVRSASDQLTTFYSDITRKAGNNKEAARKADTVYHAVQIVTTLIDRTMALLQEKDNVGSDTLVFKWLLSNTPLGDSIRIALTSLSEACFTAMSSPDKKASADSSEPQIFLQNFGLDQWNSPSCPNMPTVTVEQTLAVLELGCTMVAIQTLANISYSLNAPLQAGGK